MPTTTPPSPPAGALDVAREIAGTVLAPHADRNDREGRFPTEAVEALGARGLLGLTVPRELGGAGLGPRAAAEVTAALAEADASVAIIFMMHAAAIAAIAAAPRTPALVVVLKEIAQGSHLSTLAFSESGTRSHFWAPVSRAERLGLTGVSLTARKSWVTSAGHAHSYVVSSLAPGGKDPLDSTLYLVLHDTPGVQVLGRWDGMGLRANASAPMAFEQCEVPPGLRLTKEGAALQTMFEVVLPLFNLASASVSLGLCRAAVAATTAHLKSARFEHLGASLGESLPTLRAQLAAMQIETDGLQARLDDTVARLERPDALTELRALEIKAAGAEAAIAVTSLAMRTCGGAAFSKHNAIERLFRDAHAASVMAPTSDVLREFIGRLQLGLPLF